ncbi:hypothetical protein GUJ93_ZPchr0013g34448 [Zizania palustris]|uniref:Uncharacterized protein n=1 Tax=Zizania palustris TaxID=103762 RepID=A0A8J5WXJ0_ZIZPA|nr:hypothetical protein GUJ93_ZPchr0013g34448 [Zizania palustris]
MGPRRWSESDTGRPNAGERRRSPGILFPDSGDRRRPAARTEKQIQYQLVDNMAEDKGKLVVKEVAKLGGKKVKSKKCVSIA